MAENEVPAAPVPPIKEEAPLTAREFSASLEQLTARAKASGLRPIQILAATYAKQGMAMLDGLLSSLDETAPKPPPQKVEAPEKKG